MALACASWCVADDARRHLRHVSATYANLKSLQVESVGETTAQAAAGNKIVVPMALFYQRPNNIRVETKNASRSLQLVFLFDGTLLTEYRAWTQEYSRGAGEMHVHFTPERGIGMGEMLYDTIHERVRSASVGGQETLQLRNERWPCVMVDVEYSATGKTAAQYRFWIEPQRGLILRRSVRFEDAGKPKEVQSTVTSLTLDEEIPASVFRFDPPSGAKETRIGESFADILQE